MKVRVTTAKGTYWVEEDDVDAIDDDTSADDEVPSGDLQEVEAHDADHEGGLFAWLGDKFQVTPHMAEWLVGLLIAFVAVALTAYMARDLWFTSDEWEFLASRTAFDLGDLTRPKGGHWATWSVLLLRGLYSAFGVDFWPWFYIPRLIGHTLLSVLIWRVVRWRRADARVALIAFATLLVLGASGYQRALQVGNWVVYASLVITAVIITRRAVPTTRDKVLVSVTLMVGVLGNGYSIAVIAGLIAALLLYRRLVVWIPSLVPPVAAYVAWYLVYRDDIRPKPDLQIANLLDIPISAFRVTRTAVEAATGLPGAAAALVVVGIVGWIVALAVRRKLDLFDVIVLATLAVSLSMLAVQRIAFDPQAAYRLRYAYSVSILLTLVLVPHIRVGRRILSQVALVAVGIWLITANVVQMRDAINVREDVSQQDRLITVTAANMIAAGEPVVAGPSILGVGPDVNELQHLIDDGYQPDPLPADQADLDDIVAAARGALRMNLMDQRGRAGYFPPEGVGPSTEETLADGCLTLDEGEPVTATVTDAGVLTVTKSRPQSLALTWDDDFGEGLVHFDDPDIRRGLIELADPDGTADLTLESKVGSLVVCGFEPAPSAS